MPRSVQEIDAEIAQVKQLIAEREKWEATDRRAPEYRAARFDYILGGDRSGLDSYINRVNAANEARKQREFAEAENEKNRAQQEKLAAEAKVRSQQEDQDLAMKNLRDSASLLDKSFLSTGNEHEKKMALSGLEYDIARAKRAGIPDATLAAYKEKYSAASAEVYPKQPGDEGTDAPATPADAKAPAEAAPKADWNIVAPEVERLYNEANTSSDIAAADKRMDELKKDWGNSKEYEGLLATGNKNRDRVKKKEYAARKNKAMMDAAKTFPFLKSTVRKALGLGKEGGGGKDGKIQFSYTFDGGTHTAEAAIKRNGKDADIIVGTTRVQTIPLF